MPANLTPPYLKVEANYKAATTLDEKLFWLHEMIREVPKHKGTEKIQADIKRRIAQLTKEAESSKGQKRFAYRIEKQGAGCVLLAGAPNVGKSALVNALTNANAEVADYPFTTREPHQAMMMYEDIPLELVDLPPVSRQHVESWLLPLMRVGDLILLVLDLSSDDILDMMEESITMINEGKIRLVESVPAAEEMDVRLAYIPTFLLLHKCDHPRASDNKAVFMELYDQPWPVYETSIHQPNRLVELKRLIVQKLDLIRVYSKTPGHEADLSRPYILKRGSQLLDFAQQVHKDFAENLNFAKVWGSATFDGQRVERDYQLHDKDVIELHL